MHERATPSPGFDDVSRDLSREQRLLRQQRARREAAIAQLLKQRELLEERSHERMSLVDKLKALGMRAHISTELSKLRLELRAIDEFETSERNRYASYIAPVDLGDIDNDLDE
jgi:hypothetical protein